MVDLKIFHDVTSSCKIFLFLKRLSTMQCDCSSECINISRTFLKQLESMRNEKRREGERNANMHSYFIKNITKWQCNWKVMAVANCNFHFYSMLFLLALYLWFSVNDGIVLHTHTHIAVLLLLLEGNARTSFSWQWNDFTISQWLLAVTMERQKKYFFCLFDKSMTTNSKKRRAEWTFRYHQDFFLAQ